MNGQASGPVLTSGFSAILDHGAGVVVVVSDMLPEESGYNCLDVIIGIV